MASYKVIQDVEAEDKLIGPLTMKQFLFAMIAFFIGAAAWLVGKYTTYYLAVPIFALTLPFIALALPLGRDQPNDVWLLARLNFLLRPHLRLWSQTGNSSQTINIVRDYEDDSTYRSGDGRTAEEIEIQLRELSQILDNRGHAAEEEKSPVAAFDAEHENQNETLGKRFHQILHHHKTKRLKDVELNLNQTLRSQDYHLSQYAPSSSSKANNKRKIPSDLVQHINTITDSNNFKISTLESMVKAAKLKQSRAQKT